MTLTIEKDTTYNGWVDYTTWNCALWIGGDESFYNIARECRDYIEFLNEMQMIGSHATPDGADWGEADLDEMNEMMEDLQIHLRFGVFTGTPFLL